VRGSAANFIRFGGGRASRRWEAQSGHQGEASTRNCAKGSTKWRGSKFRLGGENRGQNRAENSAIYDPESVAHLSGETLNRPDTQGEVGPERIFQCLGDWNVQLSRRQPVAPIGD
jgi:hypothetical protein